MHLVVGETGHHLQTVFQASQLTPKGGDEFSCVQEDTSLPAEIDFSHCHSPVNPLASWWQTSGRPVAN